ncbi:MAG: ATP-binding protein [Pseudomonadota bacterium]
MSGGMNLEPGAILSALAEPVFVVDRDDRLRYTNPATEQFFKSSAQALVGRALVELLPADSPVFTLIRQVRNGGHSVTEYGVTVDTPRTGSHHLAIDAAPVAEQPDNIVLGFHLRSIAGKLDRQLSHRDAARSVSAMAAMLAHELKNPLSGIRGAAQLLEHGAAPEARELTRLICEETDRIVNLVDRMEMFSDEQPIARQALNIHEVLEHLRKLAQSGFAQHLRFVERYDPSLPPVLGNRDLLLQALLNLIKNAAEAAPEQGGEIRLSTAYRQGVRLALPGAERRVELPLVIGVADNGTGIAPDILPHLFDPFVTSKHDGKGLGLALVAKIVASHGGVIEVDSEPRRTEFRILLPAAPGDAP